MKVANREHCRCCNSGHPPEMSFAAAKKKGRRQAGENQRRQSHTPGPDSKQFDPKMKDQEVQGRIVFFGKQLKQFRKRLLGIKYGKRLIQGNGCRGQKGKFEGEVEEQE